MKCTLGSRQGLNGLVEVLSNYSERLLKTECLFSRELDYRYLVRVPVKSERSIHYWICWPMPFSDLP